MALHDKFGDHGDTFYSSLMAAHEGLSEDESHRLNARLVLTLANEISDIEVLQGLVQEATALTKS
jgi:hypothetical protein